MVICLSKPALLPRDILNNQNALLCKLETIKMSSSASWKQSKCAILQVRITSGRYKGVSNAENIISTRLGLVLESCFPVLIVKILLQV